MELLAAIYGIVYGIWGFFVLAPFLRVYIEPWLIQNFGYLRLLLRRSVRDRHPERGIILAIMVIPIISISREVLIATPRSFRKASLALRRPAQGRSRW